VRNRHHADCHVAVERAADRYTLICDGPLICIRGVAPGLTGAMITKDFPNEGLPGGGRQAI
jgi:hypothetical protein